MSSGFMSACIAAAVPVLFFVGKGRAYGSLVGSGMPNPLRLRAQYDLVSRSERRIPLARQIVHSKLRVMRRRLERQQQVADSQRVRIERLLEEVDKAPDPGVLRGLEGAATRVWYEAFGKRIQRSGFEFNTRTKRPPRDPINSLLSFAYSLIFGEMQTALLAHGLDPHPGLLHDLRLRHPALASDLIEPYRILIADTFVLSVVNRGQFDIKDFGDYAGGGVYLSGKGRRRFLHAFEEFIVRPLGPPGSATPRQLLEGAALAMLRVVLGDTDELDLPLRCGDISSDNDQEIS